MHVFQTIGFSFLCPRRIIFFEVFMVVLLASFRSEGFVKAGSGFPDVTFREVQQLGNFFIGDHIRVFAGELPADRSF